MIKKIRIMSKQQVIEENNNKKNAIIISIRSTVETPIENLCERYWECRFLSFGDINSNSIPDELNGEVLD